MQYTSSLGYSARHQTPPQDGFLFGNFFYCILSRFGVHLRVWAYQALFKTVQKTTFLVLKLLKHKHGGLF